jgi:hypothetical protein
VAEVAADFMTTFYHVQVGALETEEFEGSDGDFGQRYLIDLEQASSSENQMIGFVLRTVEV